MTKGRTAVGAKAATDDMAAAARKWRAMLETFISGNVMLLQRRKVDKVRLESGVVLNNDV